jgi:uncharacterized tellurite resistance protein B-like protein
MLDRFFALIADLAGEAQERFEEGDYRVAAAALLVHVMEVDGEVASVEREKLASVLSTGFDLSDDDTAQLIAAATDVEQQEENWTSFADLLERTLDEAGRRRIVEMMWSVVLADGSAHELEEAVVARAAELMGVEPPVR